MTTPVFGPAITDADLARLLGAGGAAPAIPADLADRIMAALPVPALPPAQPTRRRGSRWARGGLVMIAGLGLASAVAAGLARTPFFAPTLAPVMARIAAATGLPALAPPPAAKPVQPNTPSPRIVLPTAPPSAPARINAALPPPVLNLPAIRPETVPAPPNPAPNPAPRLAPPARPALPAARLENPLRERPSPPNRPILQEIPAVLDNLPARGPTAGPDSATAGAAPATAGTNLPLPGNDSTVPGNEIRALAEGRPEISAEIAALRDARKSGNLTPDQAQRLRSLQQLRALRAARPPRDALPRNRR